MNLEKFPLRLSNDNPELHPDDEFDLTKPTMRDLEIILTITAKYFADARAFDAFLMDVADKLNLLPQQDINC